MSSQVESKSGRELDHKNKELATQMWKRLGVSSKGLVLKWMRVFEAITCK